MILIAQMGALLLQGATTAGKEAAAPVGSGSGWYVLFTQITSAASVVVFLVLMLILIPALVKFKKTAARLDAVLDRVERSIEPVTRHATHIADNVDYISTSIRSDVQELRKTLLSANTAIRGMIETSERRLHELSAVLRVVQEEAEHAFVSTASTIRGVRAGAATLRANGALPSVDLEDLDDEDDEDELVDLDDAELQDEGTLAEFDELDVIEDEDDDLDSGIETINDLDAANEAAEDMTNGDINGPTFGRAEPRIKRARRHDRG
ncbi:MAG: DUF948 domain-containing protein [Gemmatimonadota bacterium]